MRHLYSAVLYALLPLLLLRMLWRSRRAPAYRRRLAERFGLFPRLPDAPGATVVIHAVSVGEVAAAAPLVTALLDQRPDLRLVVTTTTPTGSARVRALFGERVAHVYLPWDLPGAVRRFLRRVRPQLLVIMETELWPNLLHIARGRGCRTLLANARLSERSARGYARVGALSRRMLADLDLVACQGADDARRYAALGLPAAAIRTTGNIKFDLAIEPELRAAAQALRQEMGAAGQPLIVGASTHPGEDEQLLDAFRRLRRQRDCLLVLAPRHPERFEPVYRRCATEGWCVRRRTAAPGEGGAVDILLLDTLGELGLFYGVADLAFIGGSLVERGGHNMLEAAAWGLPLVCGPHLYNFRHAADTLVAAGALEVIEAAEELAPCLMALLADPGRRAAMGRSAERVMQENRGATREVLDLVEELLRAG